MADDAPGDKIRLRFSKTGDLRLLSHHDLMRCGERMLRRAELPFKSTAGFHPTPRFVFALSLPLGVGGRNEVVELELTRPLPASEVRDRLNRAAPDGLAFHSSDLVPTNASAVPRRAVYRLPIPEDRAAGVRRTADALLAEPKVWVDKYHPRPRRVNVRPYIRGISIHAPPSPFPLGKGAGVLGDAPHPSPGPSPEKGGEFAEIIIDVWVTGQGTARADDLIARLGLADVTEAGAVLERIDLELHDETPAGRPDGPPEGPPETARLDHAPASAAGEEDDSATRATWGLSPNGPVVE